MNKILNDTKILDSKTIDVAKHDIDLNRRYLVKGLLQTKQVSMLAGPSNLGKSAFVASLASHISQGKDFNYQKITKSAVLYIAAEDSEGIADRCFPFFQETPTSAPFPPLPIYSAPFKILPRTIDLSNSEEIERLTCEVNDLLIRSGFFNIFIVIDTLNLCIGEADENSSKDMGRVINNAQKLAQDTNGHVMIVHHTGAQANSRPRGSSALTANVDTLLTLQKADTKKHPQYSAGTIIVSQQKQRRIKIGKDIAYKIKPYKIGKDPDGDMITVPIVKII